MKTKCISCLCFVLSLSSIVFAVDYNDGQIHNITTYIAGPTARVDYQYSGTSTTINILPGGSFNDIWMYNESTLNLLGGTVRDVIYGEDSSHINIESGLVQYNILASDKCIVNMTGGDVVYDIVTMNEAEFSFSNGSAGRINTYHNSKFRIESGTIGSSFYAFDNSQLTMSGGAVNGELETYDSSTVTISGGNISGSILAGWPTGDVDSAVITIEGTDFHINGLPVSYGTYTHSDYTSGILTGNFANGDSLNNTFYIYDDSSIILTPEPTTLLLLGLGAVILRKRKK